MRMKQQWEMSRFAFVGGTIAFFLILTSFHIIHISRFRSFVFGHFNGIQLKLFQ